MCRNSNAHVAGDDSNAQMRRTLLVAWWPIGDRSGRSRVRSKQNLFSMLWGVERAMAFRAGGGEAIPNRTFLCRRLEVSSGSPVGIAAPAFRGWAIPNRTFGIAVAPVHIPVPTQCTFQCLFQCTYMFLLVHIRFGLGKGREMKISTLNQEKSNMH